MKHLFTLSRTLIISGVGERLEGGKRGGGGRGCGRRRLEGVWGGVLSPVAIGCECVCVVGGRGVLSPVAIGCGYIPSVRGSVCVGWVFYCFVYK